MASTALTRRPPAPGPRGHPLLGSMHEFTHNPIGLFLQLQREYGDIARIRLGPTSLHMVAHPDYIQHILQENYQNYCRGKVYDKFKMFFGEGLLTNDGADWIDHRRLMQPLFHRGSVQGLATRITDATAGMLARWEDRPQADTPLDLVPEMMRLGLSVLSSVLFSVDLGDQALALRTPLQIVLESTTRRIYAGPLSDVVPAWLPTPEQRRRRLAHRAFDGMVDQVVTAHRQGTLPADDLIGLLVTASEAESGTRLTDQQIHDEIMTTFFAGHETTAIGLTWTLYALARYPAIRRRLEHELSSVLGERVPTVDDLAQLPYLSMVVDEALRLYPPIWGFPRDAVADDTIGGHHIPAGSTIFVSPYVAHRHPAFWDNPEAFDPERFTPERAAQRPKFAYFPFGGGPRQCIGKHLALLELRLAIAMIAQRYRLELVPGHPVSYGALLSLHPLDGVLVTLRPRARGQAVERQETARGASPC